MKRIAEILSWLAFAVTLAPACLFFADKLDLAQTQMWMLAGTALWFIATPFWMEHKAGGRNLTHAPSPERDGRE